ncbi:Mbeg1-like protein, partial [Bifidobacterium animalis]|uniref:Mbeg1-like protein n=1 Tax=Bifidobacterium animalis TaxID=28025 RepID=UPI001D01239A
CPRYQNILLSNYINELDYQSIKQFAAITFQLEDSSIYVAFRGTDDTILGWREDFQMTYQFPNASQ